MEVVYTRSKHLKGGRYHHPYTATMFGKSIEGTLCGLILTKAWYTEDRSRNPVNCPRCLSMLKLMEEAERE